MGRTEDFSPLEGSSQEVSALSNLWETSSSQLRQALCGFCGEAAATRAGRQAQAWGVGPGSCGARPSCCVSEALGSLHVVGDRALSCLLTARELAHFKRGPAARPRVGLWLCAGHFPCPLPSFFFCQLGREHFLFPPAGEMVPCRGFLVWVCPSHPSGQDCASREQACFSLTPAWLFRLSVCFSLIELLGPGDLLRSYMKSHLILSPSFNGNLVW